MFDIGMQELILVLLVALVVLGPGRIPSAARTTGKVFVRVKKGIRELKYFIRQAMEEDSVDE
jgi:sec-independent protein translocase protein TatB